MLSDLLMPFCLQRGLTLMYWRQLLDQIWRRMLNPEQQGPLQTNPTDHLICLLSGFPQTVKQEGFLERLENTCRNNHSIPLGGQNKRRHLASLPVADKVIR